MSAAGRCRGPEKSHHRDEAYGACDPCHGAVRRLGLRVDHHHEAVAGDGAHGLVVGDGRGLRLRRRVLLADPRGPLGQRNSLSCVFIAVAIAWFVVSSGITLGCGKVLYRASYSMNGRSLTRKL